MKVLVLGDIHGNLPALEKVISEYGNKVDQIISHGDVVNYGPWSNECVELLDQAGATCLKGNHEVAFINGYYPGNNELVKDFFAVTYKDFKYLQQIESYHNQVTVGDFNIVHTIYDKYYYPDTDVEQLILDRNTIIGHSHYQFTKTLSDGKSFTNTGSVGQNRSNLAVINFVIIDLGTNAIELIKLDYSPSAVIQEMKVRQYPENCLNYYLSKLN